MNWLTDILLGNKSIGETVEESVSKGTGSALAGTAAELGLYFTPAGNIAAADDFTVLAKKMINNKRKNSLADWGKLAMTGAFAVPVLGNVLKVTSKLGKVGKVISKGGLTIAKSNKVLKVWKPIKYGAPVVGLGTGLISEETVGKELKFDHYGKMMTAAEIKADNIKRAQLKKQNDLKLKDYSDKLLALLQALQDRENLKNIIAQGYSKEITIPEETTEEVITPDIYSRINIPDAV